MVLLGSVIVFDSVLLSFFVIVLVFVDGNIRLFDNLVIVFGSLLIGVISIGVLDVSDLMVIKLKFLSVIVGMMLIVVVWYNVVR